MLVRCGNCGDFIDINHEKITDPIHIGLLQKGIIKYNIGICLSCAYEYLSQKELERQEEERKLEREEEYLQELRDEELERRRLNNLRKQKEDSYEF